MRYIFKYPIEVTDEFSVKMPIGAEVLCVQTQYEQVCIWALVAPDNEVTDMRFRIFGTGHTFDDNEKWDYVGTFQLRDGRFVGHLFKERIIGQ